MKQCSKCDSTFEDTHLFCPKCRSMLVPVIKNNMHPISRANSKESKPTRIKGSSNCWLFIRKWWYNEYAKRYDNCNLYFEENDFNINNLNVGDKVIFYNKYEFFGSAVIESVMKNVIFSEVDCSVNEINVRGFSKSGNVIALSDIEIFEPDFTVDVHELLHDLKLLKGKKYGEELDDFLQNGKWWIHLKGSIKSLHADDYNTIIKKAQELYDKGERRLEALKNVVLKNNGVMEREHLDSRIFKALGEPEWLLDSNGYFTNNAHKIMKTKLAKVGILFEPDDNLLKAVDLQEGEFLTGDGFVLPYRGYGVLEDTSQLVKLSDIKDEIISGSLTMDEWHTISKM